MNNLLWLAIPLVALVVGIVYAYVISRPRPAAMQDSMESFSRFRHALASNPAASATASATVSRQRAADQPAALATTSVAVPESAASPSTAE
jgi:hypothetical protein